MKNIKTYNLFESKKDIYKYLSKLINDTLYVNSDIVNDNYVGEGISEIDIDYDNIVIDFYDNAWGGIDLSEWNRLDEKYKKYIGENNFEISIVPSRNRIILSFENYDIELAKYDDIENLEVNQIAKKYNL